MLLQMQEILFENLQKQLIHQIHQWPVDYECIVFRKKKIQPKQDTVEEIEEIQYESISLKLQIRRNHILQVKPHEDTIISGFECDITRTFKLTRTNAADNQEVGQLNGIQFRSDKFKKNQVFFYLPQQNKKMHAQNLQKFGYLLGRKYIVQDGFHEVYRAIKKIGKGVTASVYKAVRLTDRKQVAVKSFKKDIYYNVDNGRGKAAFYKQFKAMTDIDCKYVCKLISVYESDNSIYIVMQLLTRSLYCHLKINGFPKLNTAKQLMVKLLIGLGQLHKKGIMHRDLKLENIMVLEKDSLIEPIIIDLGLAELSTNKEFMYIKCGTPGYVAPQILGLKPNQIPSPPYTYLCDIFSMGVIFYILLVGKTVFQGSDERQVVRKNRQCDIDYEFKNQNKLNEQMKDLLRKMLQKDPKCRNTVQELLNHQFFREVEFLKEYQTSVTSMVMQENQQRQKPQS